MKSTHPQVILSEPPAKFTVTIISKCNLRCPTCLYLLQPGDFFATPQTMSRDNFSRLLERFGKNMKRLTLTGGEPLLHPDIDWFVELALDRGIDVGMPSNGILVGDRLPLLRKISGHVQISLDAYDKKSFARNRGGSARQWQRIIAGLKTLRDEGISFDISFLISRHNLDEIFAMLDLAFELSPGMARFHSFNPHHGPRDGVLRSDDSKVKNTLSRIIGQHDYPFDISLPYVFDRHSEHFRSKICDYPWKGLFVDQAGNVAYCCHLKHQAEIGNVFSGYDFNSPAMLAFRKNLLAGRLPLDCVYCHRRFQGEYSEFSASDRRWRCQGPFYEKLAA